MSRKKIDEIRSRTSPKLKETVRINLDVLDRLNTLLHEKFGGNISELAERMVLSEEEVRSFLTGYQDYSHETITLFESVFQTKIINKEV